MGDNWDMMYVGMYQDITGITTTAPSGGPLVFARCTSDANHEHRDGNRLRQRRIPAHGDKNNQYKITLAQQWQAGDTSGHARLFVSSQPTPSGMRNGL